MKRIIKILFILGILYWIHAMTMSEATSTKNFWDIRFLYMLSTIYVSFLLFFFYGVYCFIKKVIRKIL